MRAWVKRNALALFGLALLFSFDWGIASLATCVGSEQQQAQQCAEKYHGLTEAISVRFLLWITDMVRGEYNLVVAAATIVIAVFTITLWRSTDKMWRAGEKQIVLAEKSANALMDAERPYMMVETLSAKGVTQPPDAEGIVDLLFDYRWTNYGKSPALLKSYGFTVVIDAELTENPVYRLIIPTRFVVSVGGSYFTTKPIIAKPRADQVVQLLTGEANLYFYWLMEYTDLFGRDHKTRCAYRLDFEGGDASERHFPDGPDKFWEHT